MDFKYKSQLEHAACFHHGRRCCLGLSQIHTRSTPLEIKQAEPQCRAAPKSRIIRTSTHIVSVVPLSFDTKLQNATHSGRERFSSSE